MNKNSLVMNDNNIIIVAIIITILIYVLVPLMIISFWKIFKKTGKNGWMSIIPIYNIFVMLDILNLPKWYILFLITLPTSIYLLFKACIELAHKFGKSTAFGITTVFLSFICIPMIAFDKKINYQQNNNYYYDEYNF